MEKKQAGRQPAKSLFDKESRFYKYDIEAFGRVFVALEDPTEYAAALELVGSWREWNRIKRDYPLFNNYIEEWKEEIETKLRSRAIAKVNALLNSDKEATALQAAKFLSEGGWNKRSGAGRPSASEKKRELKKLVAEAGETKEDKERMLKVYSGGK